ncbi:MAG: putative lyase [Pedosphaera sp.]|nr:putative lyase [Pedosphaera sp.]
MRKRFWILFFVLVVAMVGGIGWLVMRPSEPVYHGRALRYWLNVLWSDGFNDDKEGREASEAVHAIGTNAIPTLLRLINAKDSALALKFYALTEKQRIFKFHHVPASHLNDLALGGFMVLKGEAKGAVPELIAMYEKKKVGSPEARSIIAGALGIIGPSAKEADAALLRGLSDTDKLSRYQAALALGKIHSEPELVVPALITCLSDQDEILQSLSAEALGQFGPDAKPAVPALLKLVVETKGGLRLGGLRALNKVDPEAAAKARAKFGLEFLEGEFL